MKIRSITFFCNPLERGIEDHLDQINRMAEQLRQNALSKGWECQTIRLATTPFSQYTDANSVVDQIVHLERKVIERGLDYLSIGPARISSISTYQIIPEILSATRNVFTSALIAHPYKGISTSILNATASIIHQAASISPDGFANLRFCAMSHVQPFTPFFPAAYSYGQGLSFAFAIEGADAAVRSFSNSDNIQDARENLRSSLNAAGEQLSIIAQETVKSFSVPFRGIDFSLAPFPQDSASIAKAMELLIEQPLGCAGSLGSASVLVDILDQGGWQRAGFNGLMMPVLEDSILAERSADDRFSVKDLIMYAAVCGTGLDTVPLPGDISIGQIEAILFDIAAQSLRLKKALTARLMPIPGLHFKDDTQFDFEFFKNGRVMVMPTAPLTGLYKNSDWIKISSRYTLS